MKIVKKCISIFGVSSARWRMSAKNLFMEHQFSAFCMEKTFIYFTLVSLAKFYQQFCQSVALCCSLQEQKENFLDQQVAIFWEVWLERNKRIFNDVEHAKEFILGLLFVWLLGGPSVPNFFGAVPISMIVAN